MADRAEPETRALEPLAPQGRRAPLLLELAPLALMFVEAGALLGTAALTYWWLLEGSEQDLGLSYLRAILLAVTFFATFAQLTGAYDAECRFSTRMGWARLAMAWLITMGFLLGAAFFLKISADFSRLWFATWFASGGAALLVVRAAATGGLRRARARGYFNQRVAIFGANEQGWRIAHHIAESKRVTIDLVGMYDDRGPERLPAPQRDLALRGGVRQLVADIRASSVEQVIIALPWSEERRIKELVTELSLTPVRIRLAPDLVAYMFSQRAMVLLDSVPLMTLFERPISGADQIIKRVEDLVLGTLIALLLAPLMLAVAIAIRLDSRGPIFFRQPREGFNNRRFMIWKFRSMRADRLEHDEVNQATRADPRITRVGRFIRRTSIDELPQLLNVLRGEMSLVGPRPHAPSTRAAGREFKDVVTTYAARHKVKPGMTGWAQVNGWRGETDTEEKLVRRVEHDLHYIENWSIGFDLYILARTAGTILSRNAY